MISNEFGLTRRQMEIIVCLSKGFRNKEIARELDIGEHTVKVHLWRLFKKINVSSRSQALVFALKHELIKSDDLKFVFTDA